MSDSNLLAISLRRPRQPATPATAAGHNGRSLAFWLALFVVSVIGVAWRGLAGPAMYSDATAQASAGPHSRSKPIRDVELGEQAEGVNPLRYEVDPDDVPNARTWRRIDLLYVKPSGRSLWIGLLRPLAWIEEIGAQVGETVDFDLGELGGSGQVEVLSIGPCPRIEPGPGPTVIGKFVHERDEDEVVVELRLAGETKPTIVTAGHRYWSVDRADYVPVGELEDGETVDAEIGTSTVVSVTPIDFHGLLYNVETTEHVYRVGQLGTLVHNNGCAVTAYGKGGGHHIFAKKAFESVEGYDASKALAISQSEIARLGFRHFEAGGASQTQRLLFRELAESGRANTLAEHARIAREALKAGGMSAKDAAAAVRKALRQLKSWGIDETGIIPWN